MQMYLYQILVSGTHRPFPEEKHYLIYSFTSVLLYKNMLLLTSAAIVC